MTSRLAGSGHAIVPAYPGEIEGRTYWWTDWLRLSDGHDVSSVGEYRDGTQRTLDGMGQW
jgi:hypothetical protein